MSPLSVLIHSFTDEQNGMVKLYRDTEKLHRYIQLCNDVPTKWFLNHQ